MKKLLVWAWATSFLGFLLYAAIALVGCVALWSLEPLWIGEWSTLFRGFFAVLVICIGLTVFEKVA
ncbi:MAG: hypothetical protein JKY26_06605 [Pseudomonas sp.]|nr:hypothetical protein [Pseudomonas sp.]